MDINFLDFVDKRKILKAREEASKNLTKETSTQKVGSLFGGDLYVTVEFDYTEKDKSITLSMSEFDKIYYEAQVELSEHKWSGLRKALRHKLFGENHGH